MNEIFPVYYLRTKSYEYISSVMIKIPYKNPLPFNLNTFLKGSRP